MSKLTDDELLYHIFDLELETNSIQFKGHGTFVSLMKEKNSVYALSMDDDEFYMRLIQNQELDQVDKWTFNSKAGKEKCNIKFKHHRFFDTFSIFYKFNHFSFKKI